MAGEAPGDGDRVRLGRGRLPAAMSLELQAGKRRIACEVDAPRGSLVGVTYTDPDGEQAWCYNSEVASMRVSVFDRGQAHWDLRQTLISHGRAHFEYGQRSTIPDLELHLT